MKLIHNSSLEKIGKIDIFTIIMDTLQEGKSAKGALIQVKSKIVFTGPSLKATEYMFETEWNKN